ncbi:anthranilate synthase, component II /aminodeoxychorismate synthase, glutamine amidotransferase subunit [Halobacillus karajensis]|uniref:Para-aminobenzoate synthase glutamine amidotransferase component II n=1 Tax=Halobacillus karajensis TaxID=195088 RepID=A0A024P505_9BACI|nr:aminodeoxychorismate/anthranilate synthase component II [Halobacillus karajensis]CDQ20412.1 Para-aminobenzoate synthase glutamine amidotransferase component II [Halobacillus karajensis]CDQ24119.1 Para-aminobenzoate synthase glutamine amidotransferase component II [Halobacillus karajensis]CDQ27597.1 Para-aminobenzoate synthase glutamine amidotransferase component II [Halobacillus karajensis]SEH92057.1 anthranilate synthase, component II /aminodeoxychorismate synthase, glutamine amidotransfera
MIYMIDHYDSFTFNLVQYLGELGEEVIVKRNDEVDLLEISELNPDLIFLSPGPCSPDETGNTLEVIDTFKGDIPIFGVCLGHQAIAQVFGGSVVRAERLMHGKSSRIFHDGKGIYEGLNNPMEAMRYHSLIVELSDLPECFEVTASTVEGELMGIRHVDLPIEGVQFHPESIETKDGKRLLQNVIENRMKALI